MVAVGPGMRTEAGATVAPVVAVGDKVLLPEFGGNKIEVDGEEFQMFRKSDSWDFYVSEKFSTTMHGTEIS